MSAALRNPEGNHWESLWAVALGGFLALALIKFGNPVILDHKIIAPKELLEVILLAWPVTWGYCLLVLIALASVPLWRWQRGLPKWALALPLAWLVWQGLASIGTVNASLTRITLLHFTSCVVCFYLGLFALSRVRRPALFWTGLVAGFIVVMGDGWRQHFGGLEEARKYFYELPNWRDYPPEFLKKISSHRIYATLFYPNTLASAIILLLPALLAASWAAASGNAFSWRATLVSLSTLLALGCMYWSESKAGWLIMLAMGLAVLMRLPIRKSVKGTVLAVVLAVGLAGFFTRYTGYFERGATSVGARFDYWRAAGELVKEHPWLGSGPGTFQIGYKRLKDKDAEMARLAHNDYLEQASDSGIVGGCLYFALIWGSLAFLYRNRTENLSELTFAIWLGLAGLAMHAAVEFPLYVPALSWPMFLFLGWLWSEAGSRNQIDNSIQPP